MNANDLFKAGHLQPAIDEQLKAVKADPADHGKRLFLFELLAFAGDLERARKQIDAVDYGDMELNAAVMSYRLLLDAAKARRQLFAEGLRPRFYSDPPAHIHQRLEAIDMMREGKHAEASALLARSNEAAPSLAGELNGKPFTLLRDCDDLFAPVLEVLARDAYYWVPLAQIESVAMNPPRFPRDLLWAPAQLTLHDGESGSVFLPVLYPGSHQHAEDAVKLGRMTDWKAVDGGPVLGVGARLFLVDDAEVGVLEWHKVRFQS